MDGLPGGLHVQLVDGGHDVGHPDIVHPGLAEFFGHGPLGVLVAGDDDGGLGVELADHIRVLQHAGLVAAVGAAGEQDDIRVDLQQHLLPVFQRLVRRHHLHHAGAGGHGYLLGRLGGDSGHVAQGNHPQAAGGTAGAVPLDELIELHALRPDGVLRLSGALPNVLQGGGGLAPAQERELSVVQTEGSRLGVGAAHIVYKNICQHCSNLFIPARSRTAPGGHG